VDSGRRLPPWALAVPPTTGLGHAVLNALDARDNARVSSDQADLIAVLLFVAVGLLLTAAFFMLGFGAMVGEILAVPT
jgi:hypothetical protein